MHPKNTILRAALAGLLLSLSAAAAPGTGQTQTKTAAGTGAVAGRVFNQSTGVYVTNARVAVDGTLLQTFTDELGGYALAGLPAGAVTLRVFFTGLPEQTASVTVEPGATVTQDFDLRAAGGGGAGADAPSTSAAAAAAGAASSGTGAAAAVVQMSALVVRGGGEIGATAMAINEQRFAANIKSVVDIAEFGDLGESNVGEFVKFLPSVAIDYNGNEPRTIAVRGIAPNYTALTIDGNRAASAASGQNTRNTELVGFALHNLARIEVTKTPLPDSPADAIGGAVNLISRSAFTRRRPWFSLRAYGTFNSDDISLGAAHGLSERTSGPTIRPGFDFVYQNPLSKKFALSLSGQWFQRLNRSHTVRTEWSPASARIGTGAETAPYLSRFRVLEGTQDSETTSVGAQLDYRLTREEVLTVGVSHVLRDGYTDSPILEWMAGDNPLAYGPDYTSGAAVGRVGFTGSHHRKTSKTDHVNLGFRHLGSDWKWDAGLFFSRATNAYRDISDGFFRSYNIRRRNVTVDYAGITPSHPSAITTTIGGAALNPLVLDNLGLEQGLSEESDAVDTVRGGHLNISRDLGLANPVIIKAGLDLREQHRDMDTRSTRWNFRGPDHSGSRPVDGPNSELIGDLAARHGAGFAADHYAENKPSFGFPVIVWPDSGKLYRFFRDTWAADPLMWQEETAFANRDSASKSPAITETVTSAYLRADAKFFDNNLWLVGGVRFEHTRDDALGIHKVGADGNYTYIRRGERRVHSYDDFFPSLNASYMLARNLIARLACSRTIGRPNYSELSPGLFIDNDSATAYRLRINNPGLRPAYAGNYDLSLEYYFEKSGQLSLGVFRKDIRDFLGQSIHGATAAECEEFGLDPDIYEGSDVLEKTNIPRARIDGFEINYRQSLTFLPPWARGLQVFANATLMRLRGPNLSDFTGFQRRTVNWGVKLQRERFDASLNWSYSGRQRGLLVTGVGVPDGTFDYIDARLLLDANFGVRLTRRIEFYGSARNLTQEPVIRLRYSPATPGYARRLQHEEYGVQFTLGLRGAF
jgi:TonB-dependent receptor